MSSLHPAVSSKFPWSLEFFVDDRKKLLSVHVRHIQELFSVQVSCSTLPAERSRRECVAVTVTSSSGQEHVGKAKCYVQALCCPERYCDLPCDSTGSKLARLLFGNHSKLNSKFESQYLTCIQYVQSTLAAGQDVIRVQGGEQRVLETMSQLRSMLELIDPSPPLTLSPPPDNHFSEEGDTMNAGLLRAVLSTVEGRVPGSPPYLHQPLIARNPLQLPVNRKRVDYYVRLGFPQEIVESTIASLGPGAHDNDIMHRLNMRGTVVPQPRSVVIPEDIAPPAVMTPVGGIGEGVLQVDPSNLRPIVVDGSNVAMRHGNGQVFSCRGIQIVADYFKARGHDHIRVFVPEWRKETSRPETPISDQHILESLEKAGILSYTPSRKINGRRIVCYDDRFIVKYADLEGGVIISNDQYRDLMQENPEWRRVIEQRLLQFTFANDHFMPPDDPLGKDGPSLDQLLVKDPRELQKINKKVVSDSRSSSMPVCPHLGNCTFGRKCRYYHPDREPQKQEAATGSGSSGGSHTPSTSSRSATSSPIPDNRSQGKLHSSKSSREDLYGQFSRYSSSDDLPLTVVSSIDISELSDKLAHTSLQHQTSPTKGLYLDTSPPYQHPGTSHLSVKFPLLTPGHVKSAPVLDQGLPPTLTEGPRPPNHTFPLTQLPQAGTRPGGRNGNVTEDLTYHIQQQQQQQTRLHHGMVPSYEDNTRPPQNFIPRDSPRQGHHHHQHSYPLSQGVGHQGMGHQGGLYLQQNGRYVDTAHLLRDTPSQIQYGIDTRVGVGYASHPMMPPGSSYEQHRPVGVVASDQSIPLHNLHQQHFSPNRQPHPPSYAAPHSAAHPGGVAYQDASYHRRSGGRSDGCSERDELYRQTLAVLPGCQDRINRVMRDHPELTMADFPSLVDAVQRMS